MNFFAGLLIRVASIGVCYSCSVVIFDLLCYLVRSFFGYQAVVTIIHTAFPSFMFYVSEKTIEFGVFLDMHLSIVSKV